MPRRFDKAKRARASHAEKTRELTVAIKHSDRILARDFLLKGKIPLPSVTRQEFARFFAVAVRSRDAPLVRVLLEARPKLNATVGARLLWEVIEDADTRIAEMLVRAGADVNKSFDRHSISLLHALAKSTNVRKHELAVLMMKHGADLAARDVDDFSVLEEALFHENHALAQELLRRGVAVDEDVLWAVVDSRNPVRSLLLIVNGDHVRDATTRSALVAYAFRSLCDFDIDESKLANMTKAMFDLGIPDVRVILQAIRHKRIGVLKSLLRREDIEERVKMTFLHCATADLQSCDMARVLVEWGADIDYSFDLRLNYFNRGTRPLHAACQYESLENIRLLLQLGADVNATDDHGNTPFSYLIDNGLSEAHRLVIKRFALLTSMGAGFNDDDFARIEFYPVFRQFYDECLGELRAMREVRLFGGISFHSVLTGDAKKIVAFTRHRRFFNDYNDNADFFPEYRGDLDLRLREAEGLEALLTPKKDALSEALLGILPHVPVAMIIHYLYLNEVETLTVGPLLYL